METVVEKHRDRGTGCVYCRHHCQLTGAEEGCRHVLYLKWSVDGRVYRQSTKTDSLPKAKRMLAQKIAESRTGQYLGPKPARVTVSELAEGLLRDYRINGKKSLPDVEARWRLHLEPFFGYRRAHDVKNETLKQYVDQRQKEGASNATINRELAALKRAFNLGLMGDQITRVPRFPHLAEDNIRTGFVEDAQYEKLAAACSKHGGIWMRALFEAGYSVGWRREELLGLTCSQVDLVGRVLRLEPGQTKNKEGREAPIREKLYPWLVQCVTEKDPQDYVFTRSIGHAVRDFRVTWERATEEAGLPGLLFHDLRRTAVRNMVRAGIPERVAMQISGHRTRSVFDRYDIVSRRDIDQARRKMDEGTVHSLGTVHTLVHTEGIEGIGRAQSQSAEIN